MFQFTGYKPFIIYINRQLAKQHFYLASKRPFCKSTFFCEGRSTQTDRTTLRFTRFSPPGAFLALRARNSFGDLQKQSSTTSNPSQVFDIMELEIDNGTTSRYCSYRLSYRESVGADQRQRLPSAPNRHRTYRESKSHPPPPHACEPCLQDP